MTLLKQGFFLVLALTVVFTACLCSNAVQQQDEPQPTEAPAVSAEPEPTPTGTVEEPEVSMELQILRLTNQERYKKGLMGLIYSFELQEAANIRAKECAVSFSHTRPDGSSCHDILDEYTEKNFYVAGENIAYADMPIATAEGFMNSWMRSAAHRDNILLPDFTEMAVGIYETGDAVYAVQIFIGTGS